MFALNEIGNKSVHMKAFIFIIRILTLTSIRRHIPWLLNLRDIRLISVGISVCLCVISRRLLSNNYEVVIMRKPELISSNLLDLMAGGTIFGLMLHSGCLNSQSVDQLHRVLWLI